MTDNSKPDGRGSYTPVNAGEIMRETAVGVPNDMGYRVYKRRWFGLAQLVLLNIIVSWDVSGVHQR